MPSTPTPDHHGRRVGRPARGVAGLALCGLVLAGCTGSATDVDGGSDGGVDAAAADVPAPEDIQGGDGACIDALRSGPLIDPDDSPLGAPAATGAPGTEPLPIVNLARLETCELESTADWLGRPLVINYWASWCGPCRAEMPDLDTWATQRADEVDLVGVTRDFRQEDAEQFLDEVRVGFPSWFDPDGQVLGQQLTIRAMPTTLFVDPDGLIVHRHFGPISVDQLDEAASEHLGV